MSHRQAIVLGVGGVGSAALYELSRRGVNTLGIDRFPPGHDRGSSHGQTRIIRQAYFEHPDYVPLARLAFQRWRELEACSGQQLLRQTGLLQVGPPTGHVLQGVHTSATRHNLEVEELSQQEIEKRFPGLRVPPDLVGLYEVQAGYLRVEHCVETHVQEAQKLGAELKIGETVESVRPTGSGVEVMTNVTRYTADMAVITAGPWAGDLLAELNLSLQVQRKASFWFPPLDNSYRVEAPCPAFLYELPEGVFYGIPQLDQRGIKVAEHSGGRPTSDPLHVDRNLDPEELVKVQRFVGSCLPKLSTAYQEHAVCMYTMTPDEHFIVDRHPLASQIVIAAGLSGHGFKFTGVLGQALADLLLDGKTDVPVGFLSLARLLS